MFEVTENKLEAKKFLLPLTFHEKIKFELTTASEILKLIHKRENISPNKINDLKENSSFGPNKVIALIKWLTGFEFIEFDKSKGYKLSNSGRIVLDNDANFFNPVTHFLMHYKLVKNSELFNTFITNFILDNRTFNRSILENEISRNFGKDCSKHLTPIFNFYLADGFELEIITQYGKGSDIEYFFNPIIPPNLNIFLYCLIDWWESTEDKNEDSVLRHKLLEGNESYRIKLGMDLEEFISCLSKLHQKGFICEHLSVAPYTVVKNWNVNTINIMEQAYE